MPDFKIAVPAFSEIQVMGKVDPLHGAEDMTAIQRFVLRNVPARLSREAEFRSDLSDVLKENAINVLAAFIESFSEDKIGCESGIVRDMQDVAKCALDRMCGGL
jgi:hypothetical protein